MLQYEEGQSPLDSLEQVAIHYASAIKLKPKDPRFHFLLGQALEEQHHATEMYGLKKKADGDSEELSGAKATSLQDDILALCKLHGFTGTPTLENQLKAVDTEYHQLKEQGQSGKADYVQTLYIWLSKRAGKDGSAGLRDKESCLHRASLKYLDAWSLSPDDWEFNLHTGRLLLLQGLEREALQHLQTGLALRPCQPALRFYTGLALLQQGSGAAEEAAKEAAGFLQQGLEHVIAQYCSDSGAEQAVSEPLSSVSPHFLRGCLVLGAALQQNNTLPGKTMSGEQVYHIIAVLAAQAVCRCVCRGEVAQQLEWVLLDAHFALLQGLMLAKPGTERQASVAKRCQALAALIRLTAIAPCRELLDMQEKVCQVAVVTTPRDGHALYLLGLAQLAHFDNDPESERSKADLADACLSFQAILELEDKPQGGDPPAELTKQKWWQEKLASEKEKAAKQTASQSTGSAGPPDGGAAGRGSGRGRGGPGRGGATAVAKATAPAKGGAKAAPPAKPPVARGRAGAAAAASTDGSSRSPAKPSSKTQLGPSKSKTDCSPSSTKAGAPQESAVAECPVGPTPVNRRSHAPRLGLARALSRNADTHDQACQFYQEVISMAPEVHDAYIELAEMLVKSDPLAAVEVYCRFPLRPVAEQTFDDAFITGEIIRNLVKLELYDHPQLGPNLVAYGKVMGLGCIEKYIEILDGKFKTHLLKSIYAGIHNKSVDDKDLQDFFKFKCWL
ncbi:uncharacterized protein LOC134022259 [Osmerus eperlanus]|uniref:uncharacterized protein LOC134022259 n=1 Tax=Osmerus eperlanus TaxID=29151 RepID=UPI002E0F7EF0